MGEAGALADVFAERLALDSIIVRGPAVSDGIRAAGRERMKSSWIWWGAFAVGCWLLYFFAAADRGLIGPDEPRYASIARAMAESGDWVTPRLDGEPWFEKPALLYWLGAAAHAAGAREDQATRIPVALLAAGFLVFFYFRLREHFGEEAARLSTLLLGTSTGYVAYSVSGVFDLPLTAALGAALLALLEWTCDDRDRRRLPLFGALLGVAVLSKGLVAPAVAALAVLSVVRDRGWAGPVRDLFALRTIGPFLAVAGPWYALCWMRNGQAFADEFLWRHHVMRLYSAEIEHVQPWWFYLPVLAVALLPWTPLVAGLRGARVMDDARLRLFAWWAVGGLVFFSATKNKLPGYILPLLPPLAALLGVALSRRRPHWGWFAAAGATLALMPLAQVLLPVALANGLSDAWPPGFVPLRPAVAAVAAAIAAAGAAARRRHAVAVVVLAGATTLLLTVLQVEVFPALSRTAGVRELWKTVEPRTKEVCVGDVRRHVDYGLGFYSRHTLPDCSEDQRPLSVQGDPPRVSGMETHSTP